MDELSKLPDTITSVVEASALFGRILGKAQEFLNKILLTEEIDKNEMHSMSRLTKIIYGYSHDMQGKGSQNEAKNMFLLEEIILLEEMKGIELPDFLPRAAFRILLEKKVKGLSFTTLEFIHNMWAYIEDEVISVLTKHFVNYPQLLPSMMWAVQNLVAMERKQSEVWVLDVVEMERKTDYTCSPDYLALWKKLMAHHKVFVEILEDESKTANMAIDGYGNVDVSHLRSWTGTAVVHEAFDLKMRLMSYWKIVLQRFVDCVALHLLFCIRNLVNKDLEVEITKVVLGPEVKGPERMLEELPAVAEKRKKLKHSIALLEESKDALAQIDNDIAGIRMGQVV
ncbi:Dynamin-related protein 4C [Striga hermonthica]|uniref:Dynamin-related protein 4C n=1 Tax=Striga hermonthica TaxID=68872 RepID=A0A9N7R4X5_STRHE|nr:Dynamin-related protein 4C [Striga hermonthica]